MLIEEHKFGSYGLRFQKKERLRAANIWSIGWETQTSENYYWDGMKRQGKDHFIFQYTLSGRGAIEIEGRTYDLPTGKGFFVKIPSDHRYYFPKGSEEWTFVYITLYGEEAAACWESVWKEKGSVVTVPGDASMIQVLLATFQQVADKAITDSYLASARAYTFLMECFRFLKEKDTLQDRLPDAVSKAVNYIELHYNEAVGVEEIAAAAGLSKYYFIQRFRESTGTTPTQYMTKLRIEKAVELLRSTNFPIHEIAEKVGYSNANYFNKVFRKMVGTSAGQLREGKYEIPIDHVILQ
ncbi:helix-turn-helix domain-containing protein [Alteribacillus sp. HJP-4]|uniref:AraC family transcriptional regulator n=1 Tax=Alteribacillus sp. HJP-4 TaxID=2775394 RepID=UPI0035CCCCBC